MVHFLLGKDSIITNKILVSNIINYNISSGIEFVYKILSIQIENGYRFSF